MAKKRDWYDFCSKVEYNEKLNMKYKIAIIVCVASLVGCQLRENGGGKVNPIPVEVQVMAEQVAVSRHTYVGEVEEKSSVALSSSTAGRVLWVGAKRGEKVQAGQVLLSMDSAQAVQTRLVAEALLHQAEDGYARACALYKEGGVTEQKRIELESQLAQARSMYASAVRMVEDCRVVAPVAGVVSECRPVVGETVVPGVPLVTIINMDGFVVRFAVPETEIAGIRPGDKAAVQVPALGADNLPAVVTDKSLVPSRIAHTYEVTVALGERANLLPGMLAKVRMDADVVTGFVLPQECVQLLPDGAKVWVVEKNEGANTDTEKEAVRRTVVVGEHVQHGVMIVSGLEEGDEVVTKGYQKLWQGAEITY